MITEENIAVEKKIVEEFNKGNVDILDEVCAPGYIYHGTPDEHWDVQHIKAAMRMMFAAFPDFHATLDDIVAVADKVSVRVSCQGTHRGEIWGVPPTGKKMAWSAIVIDHFADGKIVAEWECMDFLGLMRQLGVVPEAARV